MSGESRYTEEEIKGMAAALQGTHTLSETERILNAIAVHESRWEELLFGESRLLQMKSKIPEPGTLEHRNAVYNWLSMASQYAESSSLVWDESKHDDYFRNKVSDFRYEIGVLHWKLIEPTVSQFVDSSQYNDHPLERYHASQACYFLVTSYNSVPQARTAHQLGMIFLCSFWNESALKWFRLVLEDDDDDNDAGRASTEELISMLESEGVTDPGIHFATEDDFPNDNTAGIFRPD